jgi:Ca2+-transporting ATPase
MTRILHQIPGRVRIKVQGLHRFVPLKSFLEGKLSLIPWILEARANPATGNLIIRFQADRDLQALLSRVGEILEEFHPQGNGGPSPSVPQALSKAEGVHPDPKAFFQKSGRGAVLPPLQDLKRWHSMNTEDLLGQMETTPDRGLTAESARGRLLRWGPNTYRELRPRSFLRVLAGQFRSLPSALVGFTGVWTLLRGNPGVAFLTFGTLIIGAVIDFLTEREAESILTREGDAEASARVIRDSAPGEIPETDLVAGDILLLHPGMEVPADGRVIQADNLTVDQSALTGESLPTLKIATPLAPETPVAERNNMVYKGTLVTGGSGAAVVVATGRSTEFGRLQTLLGEILPPEACTIRFLNGVARRMLLRGCLGAGFVLALGLLRGYGGFRLLGLAPAVFVAALPVGFSLLATTLLSRTLRDLRQYHIRVRRLGALGNLGSIQVVCLDKTGTITQNRMSVLRIFCGMKRVEVEEEEFFSEERPLRPSDSSDLFQLLRISVLCNEAEFLEEEGHTILRGSSTEMTLLRLARSAGLPVGELRRAFPVQRMTLRSESRPFVSSWHRTPESQDLFALKGSPFEVLEKCDRQLEDGDVVPLLPEDRRVIVAMNVEMASDALRVLGVAYSADETALEDGKGYIWAGLIGMADPLRKEARELIAGLHRMGIETVIITGDQTPTAYAIGRKLGVSGEEEMKILDAALFAEVPDHIRRPLATRVHVFAKASPSMKSQIIQAYQNSGRVVAMVGDGINDAPALRMADVGVTLGRSGKETALRAADLVLERDELHTLLSAIQAGRSLYRNMEKTLRFLLVASLGEMIFLSAATGFNLGYRSSPLDSLWTSLMVLGLGFDSPDSHLLPDRLPDAHDYRNQREANREAMVIAAGAAGVGAYGLLRHSHGLEAGTLAYQTLHTGALAHAFSVRREKNGASGSVARLGNPLLRAVFWGSLGTRVFSSFVPGLNRLVGFSSLSLPDALAVGGGVLFSFLANRSLTEIRTRKAPDNPEEEERRSS